MGKFDLDEYRAIFRTQLNEPEKPFAQERRPFFSSAAAAQEEGNSSRLWRRWGNTFIPWQYGDWVEESLAVHRTAFLGDWTAISKAIVKGPDAERVLHRVGVADLAKFSVGRIRHFVMTNEDGKVASEGVLVHLAENEYFYSGGGSEWLVYQVGISGMDVTAELVTPDHFIFELQGQKSFHILQAVGDGNLRDLEFNNWKPFRIANIDLRILRTGVSGELGYEIHGPAEFAADIWRAVIEGGQPFGIVPLGLRSQVLAHVEAGIATCGFDYMPSSINTPGRSQTAVAGPGQKLASTYPIKRVEDLFRSPFELNWCSREVVGRRDFIGSDALRAELAAGGPPRRLVGLIWNSQDVIDIYASLFSSGEIDPQMDLPRRYIAEYYGIVMDGNIRGCASSRVYSAHLKRMISLAVIDRDVAIPGFFVTVLWGESVAHQKEIRAEIVDLPFKPDRRRTDVSKL